MSQWLFAERGLDRLAKLCNEPFLIAFDFDGTLAGLVDDPCKAEIPHTWRKSLESLVLRVPVAVISGRGVTDLNDKLGIHGCAVVGNHGAQTPVNEAFSNDYDWIEALAPIREQIRSQRSTWEVMGVTVEDKAYSIALHYRNSAQKNSTRIFLERMVKHYQQAHTSLRLPPLHVWKGHDVINIASAYAPDKGDALLSLLRKFNVTSALYVGDDSNDEPAFEKLPPGSITIRIGTVKSAAQFYLHKQNEVGSLLTYLVRNVCCAQQ